MVSWQREEDLELAIVEEDVVVTGTVGPDLRLRQERPRSRRTGSSTGPHGAEREERAAREPRPVRDPGPREPEVRTSK